MAGRQNIVSARRRQTATGIGRYEENWKTLFFDSLFWWCAWRRAGVLAFDAKGALALALPAALAFALTAALAADNNVQKTPITKTKTEKVCRRHYIGRWFYEVFAYCLYNDCWNAWLCTQTGVVRESKTCNDRNLCSTSSTFWKIASRRKFCRKTFCLLDQYNLLS